MYYYGHIVEENYETAFEWLVKAADQGNTTAINNLEKIREFVKGCHGLMSKRITGINKCTIEQRIKPEKVILPFTFG